MSDQQPKYDEVLAVALELTPDDKLRLIVQLTAMLQRQFSVLSATFASRHTLYGFLKGVTVSSDKITIMVISDESYVYGLLEIIGSNDKYQLLAHFEDGADALVACTYVQPLVIIMSMSVPPMSAPPMIPVLMKVSPNSHFIVAHASGDPEHMRDAIHFGAHALISMPYDKDQVDLTIQKILRHPTNG